MPEIKALFEKNIVSKGICGTLESVQESFSRPISYSHKRDIMNIHERYAYITKTWAGYTEDEDSEMSSFGDFAPPIVPIQAEPKIERNAPCPCGSGKKYKKCCLKN